MCTLVAVGMCPGSWSKMEVAVEMIGRHWNEQGLMRACLKEGSERALHSAFIHSPVTNWSILVGWAELIISARTLFWFSFTF